MAVLYYHNYIGILFSNLINFWEGESLIYHMLWAGMGQQCTKGLGELLNLSS